MCWKFLSAHISFRGRKYRKLLDMQGYDPNLLSRYIGLSKKPHQALSILVIPIHEKMASGPWTIRFKHAHHETKGSRSGRGVRGATESLNIYLVEKHEWILEK